jgi:archaetidylinositol phosphate synthase
MVYVLPCLARNPGPCTEVVNGDLIMTDIPDSPRKQERINDILLGPLERPALAWLVKRMPAWVTPDILTGLGAFAALLIGVSYWLCNFNHNFLWLASLGFLVNWFGDSLDGSLARFRKIERPRYGFFIDHTIDAFSQTLIFLGIGLSPFVDFGIACLCLIGYLLMDILVYINTYITGRFRLSYGKLGPTEVRVIAILVNTAVYFTSNVKIPLPIIGAVSLFNFFVGVIASLFFYLFITNSVTQGIALSKEEVQNK